MVRSVPSQKESAGVVAEDGIGKEVGGNSLVDESLFMAKSCLVYEASICSGIPKRKRSSTTAGPKMLRYWSSALATSSRALHDQASWTIPDAMLPQKGQAPVPAAKNWCLLLALPMLQFWAARTRPRSSKLRHPAACRYVSQSKVRSCL